MRPHRTALYLLALLALACLPYVNSLWNDYVFDDVFVCTENPFVDDLGNLRHLFDRSYFVYSLEASYRPVCTASYFLDRAVFGPWPPGPRVANLLLYAGLVLLLFPCFRAILGSGRAAFIGAALFAVHPVHTEVVNSIGFREDILTPLFLVGSWLAFRRSRRPGAWPWLPAAWLLYALAALAKESAVVFPLLAGLLAWVDPPEPRATDAAAAEPAPQHGRAGRLGLYFAGLAVVTVLFLLLRFHWMQYPGEAQVPRLGGSLLGSLLADVRIQARYLRLLVLPVNLRAMYAPAHFRVDFGPAFWFALAALLALAVVVIRYRRSRLLVFAFLWWFVSLAPVANVYPIFNPMAERYLFMPSIGPCLLAGWLVDAGLRGRRRVPVTAAALAVGLALAVLTALRNPAWRSEVAIWQRLTEESPNHPVFLTNLATSLCRRGDYAAAVAPAQRAIELGDPADPTFSPVPAHIALGCARFVGGDHAVALGHFRDAERRLPYRADVDTAVYRNLALIHEEQGHWQDAAVYYTRAAEIDAFRPKRWTQAAHAWLRAGNRARAAALWERAGKLDPDVPPFEALTTVVNNEERPDAPPR